MKKLLGIAICFISLCSVQTEEVAAQSTTKQVATILSSDANQQIQDLILRYLNRWSSEGYSIKTYREFQYQNGLPSEIKERFQRNYVMYANDTYGNEGNSFVIYKNVGYGVEYQLQVIEDCPSPIIPNKYTRADVYVD